MRLPSRILGQRGERRAAWFYRLRGYRIVARNVRLRGGEIDLVVRRGRTLVFAEVKARQSLTAGYGVDAVDRRKKAQRDLRGRSPSGILLDRRCRRVPVDEHLRSESLLDDVLLMQVGPSKQFTTALFPEFPGHGDGIARIKSFEQERFQALSNLAPCVVSDEFTYVVACAAVPARIDLLINEFLQRLGE